MSTEDAMYAIRKLFGENAVIKDMHQNEDSVYVDITASSIRRSGEYFIRKVADKDGYWGFMLHSMSFAVIPAK